MKHVSIILAAAALVSVAAAQQKVSERASLSAGNLAPATDILPIVDISAGTGGSKKITINDLFTGWGFTTAGKTLATAADAAAQRTALDAAGLSATQTLTNKTLGSGTAITAGPAMTLGSDATGDIYYRDGSGVLTRLGIGTEGHVLKVASGLPSWSAGGAGAAAFTDLTDVPAAYTGQAGKFVAVAATEDGLEFATPAGGGDLLAANNLSDLANAATARTNLGLAIGTNVQAWDSDLDAWAAKTAPTGAAVGTSDTQTLTNKTLGSGTDFTAGPVMTLGSDATGDLYYRNGSGVLTRLGIGTEGHVLKVASGLPSWSAGGAGAAAFTDLTDVPAAYTGQAGKMLVVKATEDGLEFDDVPAGGGSLTNWTEAVSTAAPNATVPAVSFVATNAATNVDAVLAAKGTGAILAQVPDNGTGGGAKRGQYAVDWQHIRTNGARVASGDRSVISGGGDNTASGSNSAVPGGANNNASGNFSLAANFGCTASGGQASAFGFSAVASGNYSFATGQSTEASGELSRASGYYSTARSLYGARVHANGRFSSPGDAQAGKYLMWRTTGSDSPSELTLNGSTGTNQRIIIPVNYAYKVRGQVIAREPATGNIKSWNVDLVVKCGATAATIAFVGTPSITEAFADAGAAAWTLGVSVLTTTGQLRFDVTGESGKTIRWLGEFETLEVG